MDAPDSDADKLLEAFEAVIESRGRAPLRPVGNGRTRPIKTDQGREVTHADLMRGLLKRAEIEIAVEDGKRPKSILCADCKTVVQVTRKGGVPSRCKRCSVERRREVKQETDRKRRAKNPEKLREQERKRRAKNPEKLREQERKRRAKNPEKTRETSRKSVRNRRAANPEKFREAMRRSYAKKKAAAE